MKRTAFLAAVLLIVCDVQSAHSFYVIKSVAITDLGTLGGAESVALDVNRSGEIVGWSHTVDGRKHPFLFSGGQMQNLSFIGPEGEATSINDSRQIVGTFRSSANSFPPRAFIWENGVPKVLREWMPGWIDIDVKENCIVRTEASAISNSGVISGNIDILDHNGYWMPSYCYFNVSVDPVLWTDSETLVALWNTSPAPDPLYDVNSSGVVVGHQWSSSAAVRYQGTGYPQQLPIPPESETTYYGIGYALGVNEQGHVVGYFTRHDLTPVKGWSDRAFWWSGFGSTIDLGVLPTGRNSVADDVNDQVFIAGYADMLVSQRPLPAVRVNRGFLYHAHFGLYVLPKLPTSDITGSCEAYALSNRHARSGVIRVVGFCDVATGRHAVRWDVQVAQVPLILDPQVPVILDQLP